MLERVSEGAQRLGRLADTLRPALPPASEPARRASIVVDAIARPSAPTPTPPVLLPPEDLGWALARHVTSAFEQREGPIATTSLTAEGYDTEQVRQMRVASRRLRCAIRLYGPWLAKKRRRRLEQTLKQITGALGPLRDLDVVLGRFELPGDADPLRRAAAEQVRARLATRHDKTRRAAAKAIRAIDREALQAELAQARRLIVERLTRSGDIRPVLLAQLERLVAQAFEKTPVPTTLDDRLAVHEVRILAKQLRYAHEWMAPALQRGPGPRRVLKRAQRAVGDMRDLELFAEQLAAQRDALSQGGQPTLASALGAWHDEVTAKRIRADRKVLPALANLDARTLARLDRDAIGLEQPS